MEMSLDTKMGLGVLSSKREIVIEDPLYTQLLGQYRAASQADDRAGMDKAASRLTKEWFKGSIKPGQARRLDSARQVNCGEFPGAGNLSAVVRWTPGPKYLQVAVDVVDASFSTDCPKGQPWEASCVEILVSPCGAADTINQFFVIPRGDGGVPVVEGAHTDRESEIIAAYKRTATGYKAGVKIPYSILRGYRPGWKVLPVEAMVNSRTPRGRSQLIMTAPAEPWQDARGYAGLRAR